MPFILFDIAIVAILLFFAWRVLRPTAVITRRNRPHIGWNRPTHLGWR